MAIIKSHGVQINADPRKTLNETKTLPWELFEARTATERFFHRGQNIVKVENPSMGALRHVCENINQELLQKGFSPWTKYSKTIQNAKIIKSHTVQINIVPIDSMGALRHVCENTNQELLQKGF